MLMNFDLSLPVGVHKLPVKTPTAAKKIASCKIVYEDGTELELPVENNQGLHRINDYSHKGKKLVAHEIFITYDASSS